MALALISRLEDAAAWRAALAMLLPGVEFRVWPEIGDGADVRLAAFDYNYFPSGVFRRIPTLGCIVFLGHGVNDLLGSPELLPGVPAMRLTDPG
ncbi:MAG: glyoxylate/hydroxypyruvate reductase A, partial [Dongiaceae bacterium]